jgi:hypothetical protein
VNDRGHVIGQDHHRAKLTDHDVDLIRELRDEGLTYAEIAEKMDGLIGKSMVAHICKGRYRSQTATGQKALRALPRWRARPAHPDEFDLV